MIVMIPFNDLKKTINELEEESNKINIEKQNNPNASARQDYILRKIADYNNAYNLYEYLYINYRIDAQEIIPYLKQKMEYLSH